MLGELLLSFVLMQKPTEKPVEKPAVVKMTDSQSQRLKDAVQTAKDAQAAVERAQKDAQIALMQVLLEFVKTHPGFDETQYDVVLDSGNYVFKLKTPDKK